MATNRIVVEKHKLPIFKKHLDDACYEYSQHPGIAKGTLLLEIEAKNINALHVVLIRATREAAKRPDQ